MLSVLQQRGKRATATIIILFLLLLEDIPLWRQNRHRFLFGSSTILLFNRLWNKNCGKAKKPNTISTAMFNSFSLFCGGSRHFSCNDVKSFVRSPRSLCSMWAMSALIVFLFHWNLKSITTKLNGKNSESWRFTMKNDELFFLCLYFSWVLDESLLFTGSILRSGTVENSKSSPLQYICMADRFTLHTNM